MQSSPSSLARSLVASLIISQPLSRPPPHAHSVVDAKFMQADVNGDGQVDASVRSASSLSLSFSDWSCLAFQPAWTRTSRLDVLVSVPVASSCFSVYPSTSLSRTYSVTLRVQCCLCVEMLCTSAVYGFLFSLFIIHSVPVFLKELKKYLEELCSEFSTVNAIWLKVGRFALLSHAQFGFRFVCVCLCVCLLLGRRQCR